MEILNEFDACQAALKKIDLDEEVMPFVRGKLLTENVDVYAKIQKLLSCKEFEPCHRFLYDLDIENIDESEASKVNNLYKLGCDRGFFDDEDSEDTADATTKQEQKADECNAVAAPATVQAAPVSAVPTSAFTVLYSAVRDGQIKTGEAFSNAISTRSAKADVISKLERAGYSSIQILAIEAGDPDAVGCQNTYCKQLELGEADDREPLSRVLDPVGVKASTANSIGQDAVQISIAEDDKQDSNAEQSASKEDDAGDKEDDASKADDAEDKKEEKAEEPAEKLSSSSELSAGDKANLKDSYKKAFKAAMLKLKYDDKCFDDLDLQQKVDFFTELSNAWRGKADPKDFMSDKEVEALEKVVVKR